MAAIRKVEDLSTDPKFIGYYDIEEAHRQDIEEAKEYGISQSKIEIAKNLLSLKSLSLEDISIVTGLSIEEIENLKK